PATSPFIVDPKMIPTISERAAGVNHAVPPSIAPRTAPTNNPSNTLFIASPPRCVHGTPAWCESRGLLARIFTRSEVLYNAGSRFFRPRELVAAVDDK